MEKTDFDPIKFIARNIVLFSLAAIGTAFVMFGIIGVISFKGDRIFASATIMVGIGLIYPFYKKFQKSKPVNKGNNDGQIIGPTQTQ